MLGPLASYHPAFATVKRAGRSAFGLAARPRGAPGGGRRLSLQGAGHQAAQEVAPQEDVDQQGRQRREQGAGLEPSTGYSLLTTTPSISARTREGESGKSVTRTPNGPSASSTAPAIAASTGMAPPSPSPLMPSAFSGDGVVR